MTKKEREVIDEIANYILPTYTFNDQKYVKLEVIIYLQKLAKQLLAERSR